MLMQRKSSDINKNNKDMSKFHIFYNVATIFLKKNYQYKIYLFLAYLKQSILQCAEWCCYGNLTEGGVPVQ